MSNSLGMRKNPRESMAKDGLIHKGLLPNQRENMGMCYYPSNALLLHI